MKTSIMLSLMSDCRSLNQELIYAQNAGFENTALNISELNIGRFSSAEGKPAEMEQENTLGQYADDVIKMTDEKGLHTRLLRLPEINYQIAGVSDAEFMRELALRTVKVCGRHGVKSVISSSPINDESPIIDYYLSLYTSLADYGISVLIENGCRSFHGRFMRNVFSEAYKLSEIADELNSRTNTHIFGICLNTGNANLCGMDLNKFISIAGNRVKSVILRDNDGIHNSSLLPFTSIDNNVRTDWAGVICGLRNIGFDGDLIIDITDMTRAFPQILRPQLFSMTKSVADYFTWQIGIENVLKKYNKRVLFGAGNMCRNYMRCYGEKYPPLFTCDNNSSRWGEVFCELEVKNPEELKRLPTDCAVFICNTFYNEIRSQLEKMKITNPIEFFNDEYLPSFSYDRLEVL